MKPKKDRLVQSAEWLIRLRWVGVTGIILVVAITSRILTIAVETTSIYLISAGFLLLNIAYFILLKRNLKSGKKPRGPFIKRLINIQISFDWLVLTMILHFSGGVENPFIIYYIFHMIIGSIILPPRDSFLQTTFALFLIGLMAFSEYSGLLPHYPLEGFIPGILYNNTVYLLGTGLIFVTTSYVVVYVTCALAARAKKNEEAFLASNLELKRNDALKNEYILHLTHDIKGHLGAIQSCLHVVIKKIHEPMTESTREFIYRASGRTTTLIRFVKTLTRLTKMKLDNTLRAEEFPVRESVQKITENLREYAAKKTITIGTDTEDLVDRITGSQHDFEELLTVILVNAIDYSPQDSQVLLRVIDKQESIIVEVVDRGIGIPENEKERIFEEFARGSNANRLKPEGFGLGLAIAKKIVQLHAGDLQVESSENRGSTFRITLPKMPPSPSS